MSFIIKKASKQAKKLRVLFSATSGSGKTYGSLLTAFGLTNDWTKICVIDTERDSASLYSDLGEYNTLSLSAPYTPERYIEAIHSCENAGMEVIIIDSITHEWSGEGGALDIHSKLGGTFQDWGKVTPRHNKFIDTILRSKSHIFCTVRRKEDYALSTSSDGRIKVQKLGLGEQTRDGFNYEMDLVLEITNNNHLAVATKDRTGIFINEPEFLITSETGKKLKDWASKGRNSIDDALDLIRICDNIESLKNINNTYRPMLSENEDFITAINLKKEELKAKLNEKK